MESNLDNCFPPGDEQPWSGWWLVAAALAMFGLVDTVLSM
jgi:hypothetical protein